MPTFDDHASSAAPVEEVWKLLYDPARFPEWWAGIGTVEASTEDTYTMYPEGYPDYPMPQELRSDRTGGNVAISCLVSNLRFEWHLTPAGSGTEISVHVEIPDAEAHRLFTQQDIIHRSLRSLATLAAK
jgi:uncharacterized protein YndB with AHSA1/START domain